MTQDSVLGIDSAALRVRLNTGPRARFNELRNQVAHVGAIVDLCEAMVAPLRDLEFMDAFRFAEQLELPPGVRDDFANQVVWVGAHDLSASERALYILTLMNETPSPRAAVRRRRAEADLRAGRGEEFGDGRSESVVAPRDRQAIADYVARSSGPRLGVLRVDHLSYRNPLDVYVVQDLPGLVQAGQDLGATWQAQASGAALLLAGFMRGIRSWQLRGQSVETRKLENRALQAEVSVKEAAAGGLVEDIQRARRLADAAEARHAVTQVADLAEIVADGAGRALIAAEQVDAPGDLTGLMSEIFDDPPGAILRAGNRRVSAATEAMSEIGAVVDVEFGDQQA